MNQEGQGVRGRSRQAARLPDHLHLSGQEAPARRSDGGRPSRCRGSDCAGRRRGCGGVPARHRRQKGVRSLQRHTVPVRAGRLQLPPPQRHEELRDAQGCDVILPRRLLMRFTRPTATPTRSSRLPQWPARAYSRLTASPWRVRLPVSLAERSVHRHVAICRHFCCYCDIRRMGGTGLEPATQRL
jgi:hypothetical protein